VTSDLTLKRLARIGVAGIALAAGLLRNDIHWGPQTVLLLGVALVCGTAIFAGLFVCAASLQFFLVNGAELTSSFTYGGSYAASQPASIFPTPLKLVFGYLVPVAFTAYLPTLAILHLPGPPLLPTWVVWCTPVAAVWVWLMAMCLWRWGTRHYQGGGG
jgi:ABC-2 type transport system permease protein